MGAFDFEGTWAIKPLHQSLCLSRFNEHTHPETSHNYANTRMVIFLITSEGKNVIVHDEADNLGVW